MYICCVTPINRTDFPPSPSGARMFISSDRFHVNSNCKSPRACIMQRAWHPALFVILAFSCFSSCRYTGMLPFLLKGVAWYGTLCASFGCTSWHFGVNTHGFYPGSWHQKHPMTDTAARRGGCHAGEMAVPFEWAGAARADCTAWNGKDTVRQREKLWKHKPREKTVFY